MIRKQLAGSQILWVAMPKQYIDDVPEPRAFTTRSAATHFIDHRIEGWDGFRLLQVAAYAEHTPREMVAPRKRRGLTSSDRQGGGA